MNFDLTAFNRIRPGAYPLGRWKSPSPPGRIEEPLRALVCFARYMGLPSIPEKTVEKLRTDPYFRYIFYKLDQSSVVYGTHPIDKDVRERLAAALRDPDAATDSDLYIGLAAYLNNFIGYMPQGFKRVSLEIQAEFFASMPDIVAGYKAIMRDVDKALQEMGLLEKAFLLAKGSDDERKLELELEDQPALPSYQKRAEFMQLCLMVFNRLVERHGYTPEKLWA
jgi:hypothetical protein